MGRVVVLGLGAVLYVTSGVMLRCGAGSGGTDAGRAPSGGSKAAPKSAPKGAVERNTAAGPDLAEIEQILKNCGIG